MIHDHVFPGATGGFVGLVLAWWVMLALTMLPTTWPWLLGWARLARVPSGEGTFAAAQGQTPAALPWMLPIAFAAGYLVVWLGFSAAAAAIQLLVSAQGVSESPVLASGLLAAAGAYQLTPLKHACLKRCRSPLGALLLEWPPRSRGALRTGLAHGLFCLGCCWVLMLLGLATGTRGWLWMGGLTALVAVEKLTRAGPRTARVAGVVLLVLAALTAAV